MRPVTCTNCGWVYFAITRKHAEKEIAKFNAYFDTLAPHERAHFGNKPSSIRDYEGCRMCGKNAFRPFQKGDCPDGVTMNPVIYEKASRDQFGRRKIAR